MNRRALGIALTYVGAVVGAGFSSGQEIWRFFARHQAGGFLGVFLCGLFFAGLSPFFFLLGKKLEADSYHLLFYQQLPFPLALGFDLLYSGFLLGSVAVMLAGCGTLFRDLLGLPYLAGVVLTLLFVLLVLYLRREGVIIVNSLLVPFLIFITLAAVCRYLAGLGLDVIGSSFSFGPGQEGWLKDSFLYGSFNLAMAVAVITGVASREEERTIIQGAVTGGVLLFTLNLALFLGLITAFHSSPEEEIPLLYLARNGGLITYLAYLLVLFFAMVSTAVANYYALTRRITRLFRVRYELVLSAALLVILPLSGQGFASLVNRLYPFYGYLSLLIVAYFGLLAWKVFRGEKEPR